MEIGQPWRDCTLCTLASLIACSRVYSGNHTVLSQREVQGWGVIGGLRRMQELDTEFISLYLMAMFCAR